MDMEDSTTDHEDVGNYCVSVREGRDLKDISDNSCKKLSFKPCLKHCKGINKQVKMEFLGSLSP